MTTLILFFNKYFTNGSSSSFLILKSGPPCKYTTIFLKKSIYTLLFLFPLDHLGDNFKGILHKTH